MNRLTEIVLVGRSEIGETCVLGMIPDTLVGIELRCISWKLVRLDPFMTAQECLHLFGAVMNVDPVPDDRQWTLELAVQQPEEVDDVIGLRIPVVVEELEVKPQSIPVRADSKRADRRDAIMPAPALLDRRPSPWSECATDERCQHEA